MIIITINPGVMIDGEHTVKRQTATQIAVQFNPSGGVAPYDTMTLYSGSLPPGWVLAQAVGSNWANGIPNTVGSWDSVVRVIDATGDVHLAPLTIRVVL